MSNYRNQRDKFGQYPRKKIQGKSECSIIFDFKLFIYILESSELHCLQQVHCINLCLHNAEPEWRQFYIRS
jgi:hypothetical protein